MNVRKSTRVVAIAASTLLVIACGGSGSGSDGGGTGAGSASGSSGGGSGSGSDTTSSSSPTSGSASSGDGGSGGGGGAPCVQPGAKSNDQGVGGYCDAKTPCPTNTFCTADFGAPVGAQFCSKTCTTDDQCGAGAFCYHEARGSGCVTDACK